MFPSLVQIAIGFVGVVVIILFGIPLVQDLIFIIQTRLNHKKLGCELPKTVYSTPLGIPAFFKFTKGLADQRAPHLISELFADADRPTMRFQPLATFGLWTIDPENVKAVLATQFKDFSLGMRHPQFQPLLGDGIFTLDNTGWSHSRAMLRPQFSREQISHVTSIDVHVSKLIDILATNKHKYTDIQELFFNLTIDTATEFLFGESVCLLSGGNPRIPEAVEFGAAFNRSQFTLARRNLAQELYFLIGDEQFKKDCELCKSFTNSFVKLALEKKPQEKKTTESYVFLDQLAQETRDPVILRDQALNILLAGRDTTASLLSFVFYELSRRPDIYAKLRKAILESFGTGKEDLTFESLKRCTYLRYVINETLRLWPTVPINQRFATRDTTIPRGGGPDGNSPVFVKKGSGVTYTVFAMHRDKTQWGPDAEEFNPDRWALPKPHVHPWAYLPFNGGPRICLGQQFALTEASYTVARILQTFESVECKPGVLTGTATTQALNSALTMCVGGVEGVPVKFK